LDLTRLISTALTAREIVFQYSVKVSGPKNNIC
jgi:hypothetical protein